MNESKAELTDRLRQEGRWSEASKFKDTALADFKAKGMTREEAGEAAWQAMAEEFPPLPGEDVEDAVGDGGRIQGFQTIPESWPELPDNVSLQAEVRWCQSNRLRVVEEMPDGAIRVHLERAGSPSPSHAALGWLDTAIRFPSKFADLVSRVLKDEQDEQEAVKRERMAIDEVRGLLAEMVEAQGEYRV